MQLAERAAYCDAYCDAMNRVIAALHGMDFAARGLTDCDRPCNHFERQISRQRPHAALRRRP